MVLIPDTQAYKAIHASQAPRRIVVAGRRAGVTTALVQELTEYANTHPETSCLYIAPIYRQAKMAFRWVKAELEENIVSSYDDVLSVLLKNGTRVRCWTVFTGNAVDFAVVDNCQGVSRQTIDYLLEKAGKAIFADTPRVDDDRTPEEDWFYQLYLRGIKRQEGWTSIVLPTTTNPYVTDEEIEQARKSFSERHFKAYIEAQFTFTHKPITDLQLALTLLEVNWEQESKIESTEEEYARWDRLGQAIDLLKRGIKDIEQIEAHRQRLLANAQKHAEYLQEPVEPPFDFTQEYLAKFE
jgi:hypothetical protein